MDDSEQVEALASQLDAACQVVVLALEWSHNPRSELSPKGQHVQNQNAWTVVETLARHAASQPTQPAADQKGQRRKPPATLVPSGDNGT